MREGGEGEGSQLSLPDSSPPRIYSILGLYFSIVLYLPFMF